MALTGTQEAVWGGVTTQATGMRMVSTQTSRHTATLTTTCGIPILDARLKIMRSGI